ncbi:sulfhydryl oxidase-like protein, partial [Euroglyphus maynei]
NKDRLIIINYYKHWSPECQRFSILFTNFSHNIRSWRPLVKLFAIDCAENLVCHQVLQQPSNDDDNEDGMAIDFPIVQFIGPPSGKDIARDSKQINHDIDTIDNLRKLTIETIVSNTFLANRFSLIPIMAKNIDEICFILRHDGDHQSIEENRELYAIIERTPETEFGAWIMLDMVNYRNFITIKRFIGDDRLLESLFSYPIKLPIILEISSTCQYRVIGNVNLNNSPMLRHQFIQSIRNRFGPMTDDPDHIDSTIQERRQNRTNKFDEENKLIHYNLSYVDLHNALRYSLVFEVVNGRRRFNGRQLQVIKRLFTTILHYFPFDNENVRRLFKRMTGWFSHKNDRLDVNKYLAAVKTADGFLKPLESWRHCNGSRPIYRGYPCGVWVLFHAMTVHEFNLTRMALLNNKNDTTRKMLPEPKVLPVMRDYIETFFTCAQCRHHFLNASSDLAGQLPYLNSSVLWLWTIHNQMNSRLSNDRDFTQDPYFVKVQFPTRTMCPNCMDDLGQYNEHRIMDFLQHYYSKSTMRANSAHFLVNHKSIMIIISLLWINSILSLYQ